MERAADRFINAAERQQGNVRVVARRRFSYDELRRVISANALYRLGTNEEVIDLLNRIWSSDPTPETIARFAIEIEGKSRGKTVKEIEAALESAVQTTYEPDWRRC